jgi:methylated-DNA-[protein]-cysteine S-methyltransferase
MYYCHIDTGAGRLLLTGHNKLEAINFPAGNTKSEPDRTWIYAPDRFSRVLLQLDQYFKGKRKTFDVEFELKGSVFQKKVWYELLKIPYGKTVSYGEIAAGIGNPKAARAVGMAAGKNPVAIIVPCHRVIGKNGSLTGFGGGLETKKYLLDLEQQVIHSGS